MARAAWRHWGCAFAVVACMGASPSARADEASTETLVEPCVRTDSFPLPASGGPFDYRTGGGRLKMVETNHFNSDVEQLVRGRTGPITHDLSFLLHVYPNHRRGLATLMRLSMRKHSRQPDDLDFSVDCYFARAIRYRPDDLVVRMLYADYLIQWKDFAQAEAQLAPVRVAAGEQPFTHYNLGLLYFELGRYKEAVEEAHVAAAQGMQLTALRDKLKAKGVWTEPAAPEAAASAASAAVAAASTAASH